MTVWSRIAGATVAWMLAALLSACAGQLAREAAEQPAADLAGALYAPSGNPVSEVEAALARAESSQRRTLVVLGANWCHDSRALAARLHESPLAQVIESHYETVLVDVGYLDRALDVAQGLGTPIYYATPTVLIVDPQTRRLVNDADRHQWGAAESIGMDESVAYFERMATAPVPPAADPGMAVIDAYERALAEKVARGYARVGPLLQAYKEGGEVPERFRQEWDEVADFRKRVPDTIGALRDEYRQQMLGGEARFDLTFPAVTNYSWE